MVLLDPEFGPGVSDPEQENENQDQVVNGNVDPDNLVNEVSKQQIVIQYLKVKLNGLTSFLFVYRSCEIVSESFHLIRIIVIAFALLCILYIHYSVMKTVTIIVVLKLYLCWLIV